MFLSWRILGLRFRSTRKRRGCASFKASVPKAAQTSEGLRHPAPKGLTPAWGTIDKPSPARGGLSLAHGDRRGMKSPGKSSAAPQGRHNLYTAPFWGSI